MDAFKQDWSQFRGFANSPWCLIPRCLIQARAQKARLILLTPPVAIPSLVLSGVGYVGGHTSTAPNSGGPHLSSSRAGVSNAPGMPQPGCMAYLRESFSSRGVSSEASALLLSSWRPKT